MMKLYCSHTSPFARKVRIAIVELGLTDDVEEIPTNPLDPTAEFLEANPLARIPVLVTERGVCLPDSGLILDYLTQKFPGLAVLPRGARRWAQLRRMTLAEGAINAAVAGVLEKRRPESIHYTPFLDRQRAVMRRALDALEREAAELTLQDPGVLEITVGALLGYLDFRVPYLEWRDGRGALAQWSEVFAQRPSMLATRPPEGAS